MSHLAWSVPVFVFCVLGARVSGTKTTELIEIAFGVRLTWAKETNLALGLNQCKKETNRCYFTITSTTTLKRQIGLYSQYTQSRKHSGRMIVQFMQTDGRLGLGCSEVRQMVGDDKSTSTPFDKEQATT